MWVWQRFLIYTTHIIAVVCLCISLFSGYGKSCSTSCYTAFVSQIPCGLGMGIITTLCLCLEHMVLLMSVGASELNDFWIKFWKEPPSKDISIWKAVNLSIWKQKMGAMFLSRSSKAGDTKSSHKRIINFKLQWFLKM